MQRPNLETRRLIGSIPEASDAQVLESLLGDPLVGRTLGGIRSPDQVGLLLDRFRSHWAQRGFGPWIFRACDSGAFVGYGGLIETLAKVHIGQVELLYALLPRFWNRGLATEISMASVARCFGQWRLPALIAFTLPTNGASRAVIEKAGLGYCGEFDHRGNRHVLYRLTSEEWQSRGSLEE